MTLLVLVLVVVIVAVVATEKIRNRHGLSPLRARIVSIAQSQVGYKTDPADTYCNRFSAYWNAGVAECGGNGNLSEEWCADFAAWVWKQAGATVAYELAPNYLNSNSASFYVWGLNHGTWHPLSSHYRPQPGDVAVYGLDTTAVTAQHVAIVTSATAHNDAPDVINGDGDRSGFSLVEVGIEQTYGDVKGHGDRLSGYVSPSAPTSTAAPKS
jgi:hypothetical protein